MYCNGSMKTSYYLLLVRRYNPSLWILTAANKVKKACVFCGVVKSYGQKLFSSVA